MRTQASRLFDELNPRYRRGHLPRYRVIRRAVLYRDLLGVCRDKQRTILLRRDLAGEELRLTLLHEMCHIGTGSGYSHGSRFLRKIRRLVKLGESTLLEDVERYDGTLDAKQIEEARAAGTLGGEISFRESVMSDLEGLAPERYQWRWPKVRLYLVETYRLAPSQVERLAPGARAKWNELSRWYRHEVQVRRALEAGKIPPPFRE